MTTKQYKRGCRVFITRVAKFTTCTTLVLFFWLAEYLELSGYLTAAISTIVWLYLPDLTAYLLENRYKLTHDDISYR